MGHSPLLFGRAGKKTITYRFRLLLDGEAVEESHREMESDIEAFKLAEALASKYDDVELAQGNRLLARVHKIASVPRWRTEIQKQD